ncbi:MAG: hypothetical protein J6Q87_03970 [Clostridia bacterium]|nr:hypothetical protein [Clostridia bacterium]
MFGLIITTKKKQQAKIDEELKKYKNTIECVATTSRKALEDENQKLKQDLEDHENLIWARTLFLKFIRGE